MTRTPTQQRSSTRRALAAVVAGAVLILPTLAMAAGGEGGDEAGHILHLFIFHFINMGLLVGAVIYFARKPFQKFLADRKTRVTAELEEARKLHEEARSMLDDYQSKLDGLENERQELLNEYRALGEAERDRIIAEAEARAERIREEAELTVAQEIASAKAALEAEVLTLASDLAEKAMRKELTTTQHKALVDGFLNDLEEQASA
ncbi:MAG: ATP synthase F0 subunit B [Myxococcota bacterium]